MLSTHITSQIYRNFTFTPTFGQKKIIENLALFVAGQNSDNIFVIDGYAGTGKTMVMSAAVKALKALNIKTILLAPTGRAAKVMSKYAGQKAFTIHKKIYRQKSLTSDEASFSLDINREKNAIFIVDEASMLSNYSTSQSPFGSGNLLEDMMKYIKQGPGCKLVIMGDSAQLPPIGMEESPALNPKTMSMYGDIIHNVLDEVVRQEENSGILFNATLLRCMLEAGITDIPIFNTNFNDIKAVDGGEILEAIEDAYSKYGRDEVIVITRSNKRANRFNEGIRRNVLYAEEEIESGDSLMVVKNNYHFTEKDKECDIDFIANGDTAHLTRIRKFEEYYGFRFAEAELTFPDYDSTSINCKIILDTLTSESPSLTSEQSRQLFYGINEDYAEIKSKAKRYKEIRENSFFNAMQVKFAYSVTCHKAQGGEWKCVFVDKMLFGDEKINRDLLRWLYTAITRATEKLYFVNFDERFFE